ncbi:MAG: ATP-dependent helicase/nuclease subunit B, partial [Candidatus Omnitrophota bacterium]
MNTLNKNIITFPFTESFIENLADYIVSTYPVQTTDYSRLAIVFGGKRPALFLKRALAKRIKKDFIAPRFFNIDEFLHQTLLQQEEFTAIQDLDNAYLMFTLAQEKTPEILVGRASFAEFLPWSREVLKFIDQLDLENIDNNKLTSVKKNAQIGYNVPDDINKLLEHVVTLRDSYHKALLQKKTYSRGFQYLRAAQLIKTSDLSEFDHIIFGNFFYFNRSEEIVIQHLFDTKQATLVFQGDSRRWPVLNRTAERFAIDISEGKDVIPTKFNLNLHRGFDAHSQVSLVRNILSGIKNHKETVIVLPNPDHIIPLLSEVSSLVQDFNISMGYPLKRSSLYALLQLVFKTQLSYENKRYYAKDYLKTMRHPFIKNLDLVGKPSVARILIHKIEELLKGQEKSDISGSLFLKLEDIEECTELYDLTKDMLKRLDVQVSTEELRSALKEMHDFLFRRWEDVHQFTDFGDNLSTLIDLLIDKSFMHLYPLNINIAHKITMVLKEFINA